MTGSSRICLVPRPVKTEERDGVFRSGGIPAAAGDRAFTGAIDVFTEQLAEDYGARPGGEARIRCVREEGLGWEAYRLSVTEGEIRVTASEEAGAFNGLQSVRQLLLSGADAPPWLERRGAAARFAVPCAEITDAPAYTWRGFMLDCSRHFYTVPFIKKMISLMALHHLNIFHWHLTDDQGWRLPVPEYPLLVEKGSKRQDPFKQWEEYSGGFYSDDDIKAVVDFAAARRVTVVPEVDLPGHTKSALAAYPELGCTGGPYQVEYRHGVFQDILCAGKDDIFTFTGAVFDTLARLFPGPYVHIGGDEAPTDRWEACPRCQARKKALGLEKTRQLQPWLTRRFAEALRERGKTAIGWDEVLEAAGEGGSGETALPEDLIVMFWRSWPNQDKEPVAAASRAGRKIIMTPNDWGAYINYRQRNDPGEPGPAEIITLEQAYAMPMALPGMAESNVLGGQANLWGELITCDPVAEYLTFPRLCALSEVFWSRDRDFQDFQQRLTVHRPRLAALGAVQCL